MRTIQWWVSSEWYGDPCSDNEHLTKLVQLQMGCIATSRAAEFPIELRHIIENNSTTVSMHKTHLSPCFGRPTTQYMTLTCICNGLRTCQWEAIRDWAEDSNQNNIYTLMLPSLRFALFSPLHKHSLIFFGLFIILNQRVSAPRGRVPICRQRTTMRRWSFAWRLGLARTVRVPL